MGVQQWAEETHPVFSWLQMVIRRGDRHRPGGGEGVKTVLTGEEKRSVDWKGRRNKTVWGPCVTGGGAETSESGQEALRGGDI